MLSGTTGPTAGTGQNGDFYIDNSAWTVSGPKASNQWPLPVPMTAQGIVLTAKNTFGAVTGGGSTVVPYYIQPLGTTTGAPASILPLNPFTWVAQALMIPGNCTVSSLSVKAVNTVATGNDWGTPPNARTVTLLKNGQTPVSSTYKCTLGNTVNDGSLITSTCSASFTTPLVLNAGDLVYWYIDNGNVTTSSQNLFTTAKCNSTQ
jgi:hypothetical protein